MSISGADWSRTALRWGFLLMWQVLAAAVIVQAGGIVLGLPVWWLGEDGRVEVRLMALAYLVSCSIPSTFIVLGARAPKFIVALFTVAVFLPISFLAPLIGLSVSPALAIATGALALGLNLSLAAIHAPRLKSLGAMLFASVLMVIVSVPPLRGAGIGHLLYQGLRQAETRVLVTGYYAVDYRLYRARIPDSQSIGGALGFLGGQLLMMSGDGHFYHLIISADTEDLAVFPLALRAPINISEFQALPLGPFRRATFSALDFLPLEGFGSGKVRLLVSHQFWHAERRCYVLRISSLQTSLEALLAGDAGNQWRLIYETEPCLPLNDDNGYVFYGQQAGGRMMRKDSDHLLLTVGDYGYDGIRHKSMVSQDPASAYGKIIELDLKDGNHRVFSSGHRNPQGLVADRQGRIWSTEQGPEGGDELNLIEPGQNYGWPLETLGTSYGGFNWPLAASNAGRQFKGPVYSWVPSVGIADVVRLEGHTFERWQDDLMAASLKSRSLYRIRIDQGRPVVIEPIPVGERVRDIIQDPEGRLIIWTDSGAIGLLSASQGNLPSIR